MYERLLQILFGQDHRFLTLRTEGIPAATQEAMASFWSDPAHQTLPFRAELVPRDWKGLVEPLQGLASGRLKGSDWDQWFGLWRPAAQASSELAKTEPVAGALVALQAMAAWVGALGEHLFLQPWEGHHWGWHLFPLIAARNLVAAEAIWSARYLCDRASGFVESAKDAPFDPALRGVIAEYETVRAAVEQIHDDCVGELAWALHTNAGAHGDNFRAELAALFWTSGDVLHADLLGAAGPADYLPPYPVVRALVDQGMRTLARAPLTQYIWLEMKDRGPFSVREHRVLFGPINNRFHNHPLHELDEIFPISISRSYARVVIGWMRGHVKEEDRRDLFDAMAPAAELVESRAPDAYLRITALADLIGGPNGQTPNDRWNALADLAKSILQWADRNGIYEPFDRLLDAPFSALQTASTAELEQTLDSIEAYRQANLGYWLSITPPLHCEGLDRDMLPADVLSREEALLSELRGARFIRLLPHLPSHYRRYGFKIDEALEGPPAGVTPLPEERGLLRFDPFDQGLAERNLRETRERLDALYEEMRTLYPAYAKVRTQPPSSVQDFTAALSAHRVSR